MRQYRIRIAWSQEKWSESLWYIGKEVASLVNNEKQDEREIYCDINGEALPQGIYVTGLQSGQRMRTLWRAENN